jgi:hypothetical protein
MRHYLWLMAMNQNHRIIWEVFNVHVCSMWSNDQAQAQPPESDHDRSQ